MIDQGGHSSRTFVFDHQGAIVARSYCDIETQYPKRAWVEHDAEAILDSIKRTITGVIQQLGKKANQLCAAGLATQRASIVCWKRTNGQVLSKVISWQDSRAADWMQTVAAKASTIRTLTGLCPSPHYGAGKLRWCLDTLPDVQAALKDETLVFGPLASFIIARLTEKGLSYTDPANASRTLLMNIKTGDWDDYLLEVFDIPRSVLPRCVPSRFSFGHIVVSKQTIPLTLVTGDQSAALFHDGKPRNDTVYVNLGTGVFIQRVLENLSIPATRLLLSTVLSEGDKKVYALEGTVNGAGSALAWFARKYRAEEWSQYAEEWVALTKAPPLFINAIGGLGSPFWVPCLRSRFIGNGDIPALFTSVLESILFLIQANLDEMDKIMPPPSRLVISGGIARLDSVCQRLANLSDLPVYRPADTEATSYGLAFLLTKSALPWPRRPGVKTFMSHADDHLKRRYSMWRQAMAEKIGIIE